MVSILKSHFDETGSNENSGPSRIITAHEYATHVLELFDGIGRIHAIGMPRNDFEAQVIKDVAKITNCALTNIEVSFAKPNESFEYDILIPMRKDAIVNVEITDYRSTREEIHQSFDTFKSKLIVSKLDNARRLQAQVITVAKGFPPPIFEQMEELAASRNVTIRNMNEENYKKGIEKKILKVVATLSRLRTKPIWLDSAGQGLDWPKWLARSPKSALQTGSL